MADAKRSANFTSKEENILLYLVKKYKDILENKKTDSKINRNKLECWKQIETEFNNESGQIFRNTLILRKKYDNLKKRTKRKFADEKCYALGTGGGPPKPSTITNIDMEIKEILEQRIDGFPSEFGGDAEIITIINMPDDNMDKTFLNEMQEERIDDICNKKEAKVTENQPGWSKNTVENLKTPKSKILNVMDQIQKEKEMNSKVSHWAASKATLESEKIRFAEEEQKTKIKMLEQKCNTECELMRKESEAKVQKLEREAEVTIEGIVECNKLKKEILLLEKHVMLQKLKSITKHDN